jgi:hypothetical protein
MRTRHPPVAAIGAIALALAAVQVVMLIVIASHYGFSHYWSTLFTPEYAAGAWGLPIGIAVTTALGLSLVIRRRVGAGEYFALIAMAGYLAWIGAYAGIAGIGAAIAGLSQASSHDA